MEIKIGVFDEEINDVVIKPPTPALLKQMTFGEDVGYLMFDIWWPAIAHPRHQSNMKNYDFPVRMNFVPNFMGPEGMHSGPSELRGFNVPNWIEAAKQIEKQGVRCIVGSCGFLGRINNDIQSAVNIPVYMSTIQFVPEIFARLPHGQRVGIVTASTEAFSKFDDSLLRECKVSRDMVHVAGMAESEWSTDFINLTTQHYDHDMVKESMINVCTRFVNANPDIGHLVFECTDMTPYKEDVEKATGLPVFDAADMLRYAHLKHRMP